MATATVIESFVTDCFKLTEAKPNILFCDICNEVLEQKKMKNFYHQVPLI